MPLAPGKKLSHFQIRGPLGAGEMAEVYLAVDERLGREVAIKVLPAQFAEDPERLARFELEARALASLNHRSIAQIYGVDEADGVFFLALELVPGETLEQRLERGALPLEQALEVCRQIAEGLEAAHRAGVVHRDLKPANIRITPEGRVKLLDFGLAKAVRVAAETEWSTRCLLSTGKGRLIGTPTYMAPEQARGKRVDRRVDLWALGCLLFECLSGRRAFAGESNTAVLEAILRSEPPWDVLPAATPARVVKVLRHCLERDPASRLADAGEACRALERAAPPAPPEVERTRRRPSVPAGWIAAAVLASVLLVGVVWREPAAASPAPPARVALLLPREMLLPDDQERGQILAWAPDAATIAFVRLRGEDRRLALRRLGSTDVEELDGTQGASHPFFSPDGRWLGYFAHGGLWKRSLVDGTTARLCDAPESRGAAWGPDGTIVLAPSGSGGLWRVPAKGGPPRPLTALDAARQERTHRWPAFLPDGKHVVFTVESEEGAEDDRPRLEACHVTSGERRVLLRGATAGRCVGERLLFASGSVVRSMPLARAEGQQPGELDAPLLLLDVAASEAGAIAQFDVAPDGSVAFLETELPLAERPRGPRPIHLALRVVP